MPTQRRWGRMNEPDVVIEENNHRQISIMDIRDKFARLAEQLVKDGEKEKAQEVIKKVVELTPNDKLPYDYSMLPVVSALYSCGLTAEAEKISVEMTNDYQKIIVWLQNLQKDGFSENREYGMSVSVLGYLGREAMINGATQTAEYIDKVYSSILGVGIEESLK